MSFHLSIDSDGFEIEHLKQHKTINSTINTLKALDFDSEINMARSINQIEMVIFLCDLVWLITISGNELNGNTFLSQISRRSIVAP